MIAILKKPLVLVILVLTVLLPLAFAAGWFTANTACNAKCEQGATKELNQLIEIDDVISKENDTDCRGGSNVFGCMRNYAD